MVLIRVAFFLLISVAATAQHGSIAGRVTGSDNGEPLPYSNVFINNTTAGTAADGNGYFVLNNVRPGPAEVVFSYVGYQTYYTRVQVVAGQQLILNIKLVVDEKILESVQVAASQDKEWEANLKRFTKIFLGTDRVAVQSRVVNPWVIEFKRDGENLLATASEPIIVENEALGYTLSYFLSRFSARGADYVIQGKVKFVEAKTHDPVVAERWRRNRLEIYSGSTRHFLKSVLAKRIHENGFQLYSDRLGYETSAKSTVFQHELGNTIEPFDTSRIEIIPDEKSRFIRIAFKKSKVEVHYLKATTTLKGYEDLSTPVSWLDIKTGTVLTDSSGNVYENLVASGYMASQRVGNMLPNDYDPDRNESIESRDVSDGPSNLQALRERVYLMTDRPYYYQGDVIWFAGHMIYSDVTRRDTLSKVLYVELINTQKKIIRSVTCYLDQGRAAGQLLLNDSVPPGIYLLRGYTNWMRNFGEQYMFKKTIRVLSPDEIVVGPEILPVENDKQFDAVTMSSDKEVYGKREKIIFRVDVDQDEYQRSKSVFSVSVVDAKQVLNTSRETILTAVDWLHDSLSHDLPLHFPIEKGISIGGKVMLPKTKNQGARVTLIQRQQEDYVAIETDGSGEFWATGFQFDGMAKFAVQAKIGKGKLIRNITMHKQAPPAIQIPAAPHLEIRTGSVGPHQPSEFETFETAASQTSGVESSLPPGLTKPDYSISQERLARERFGTLFSLIRSVPGLYVYASSNGDPLNASAYAYRVEYGSRTQEPLLVVDGRAQPAVESIAARLDQINVGSVDHVDFVKHASDAQFGMRGEGGLILVYTKEKATENGPVTRSVLATQDFRLVMVRGYDKPAAFRSPDYEKRQADFRSTVYWNPLLTTDDRGLVSFSFYSGDLATTYRITLEGSTPSGKPFHLEKYIEIK